jgi:uncharacterized protein (DUF4415 family)
MVSLTNFHGKFDKYLLDMWRAGLIDILTGTGGKHWSWLKPYICLSFTTGRNRTRQRARKLAASSLHEGPRRMKGGLMKTEIFDSLLPEQKAELETLAAMPEEQINTRDIPEQKDWRVAQRGLFFRPIKKQITLRIDADLIGWFRDRAPNGEGYQTRINEALREYVGRHGG